MAVADVKKIQVLAPSPLQLDLLSFLQQQGQVQIEKTQIEELNLHSPLPEKSDLDHRLFRLSQAIEFLSRWDDTRMVQRLFREKPRLDKQERARVLDLDYSGVLDRAEQLEKEENDEESHISYLQKEISFLKGLTSLNVPLRSLQSTETAEVRFGTIPLAGYEWLRGKEEETEIFVYELERTKRDVLIFLVYHFSRKKDIEDWLQEYSFDPFYFTDAVMERADSEDRVTDIIRKMEKEIQTAQNRLEELDREGKQLSRRREELMKAYDVLLNERGKIQSLENLGETETVFFLEGWIRTRDTAALEKNLQEFSDDIACFVRDPEPEEEPPVVLENPRVAQPFELITKLYGLPSRKSLDPTLYLAPFFFLFLGLTVSEAGYGLLVAVLGWLYIRLARPKGGLRQFLKLLVIVGIANVFIGTMVGGWFGFTIPSLMIIDPLNDPLSFLLLSLALGFIQVWFGTLLNLVSIWKKGDVLRAVFVQGGWLVLLPALVLYLVFGHSYWGILTLAGAAGIIFFSVPSRNPLARFFGGLYSLYDISRYLSDVLSYSRLLALGLATSVIAMVVNTLSQTAWGIPWLGWLVAALIFVGGHLFNLGISFLGGFVHSMRLQFVEFFSKFFEAGGKPFQPFEWESRYTEYLE
jgi:V/A-type H+/Na+-transporting ATPase subunit I